MNLLGGRTLIIAIAILLVGGIGAFFLLQERETEIDPERAAQLARAAGDDLGSKTVDVSMTISLTSPDRDEPQRFSAQGTVDFQNDSAALTYDFEDLTNAAGFFGHLDEFDVVFDGELVYVEIFNGEQPWVSFRPSEIAGLDVERLREVVMSSPLVLPDYLRGVRNLTGIEEEGTTEISGSVVPSILSAPESEGTLQLQELFERLEAKVISMTTELREGTTTRLTHEVPFPIVAGAEEDAIARVVIDIEPGQATEIVPPSDAETRPLRTFLE